MPIEIDAIQSVKSIGWTDALLSRLAANSVGLNASLTISKNAAASDPPSLLSGTWFTGGSATTTKPQFLVEPAGTTSTGWSTAGTGIGVNAASGFVGNLFDGQVGGTSYFKVNNTGVLHALGGINLSSSINQATLAAHGSGILMYAESIIGPKFIAGGMRMPSGHYYGFSDGTSYTGTTDVSLFRDAANTLALRNGTNAQTFNVYGTYTSASVYERMFMRYSTGNTRYEIGTEHTGATLRPLAISQAEYIGSAISGSTGTRIRFFFDATLGNQAQIGRADGAFAVRFVFSGGTGIYAGNSVIFSDDTFLRWGVTSSVPAIKRSTTLLQARLADDSDYATFQGKIQTHANAVAETPTATHTITIYDAAGTGYKVLCVAV